MPVDRSESRKCPEDQEKRKSRGRCRREREPKSGVLLSFAVEQMKGRPDLSLRSTLTARRSVGGEVEWEEQVWGKGVREAGESGGRIGEGATG